MFFTLSPALPKMVRRFSYWNRWWVPRRDLYMMVLTPDALIISSRIFTASSSSGSTSQRLDSGPKEMARLKAPAGSMLTNLLMSLVAYESQSGPSNGNLLLYFRAKIRIPWRHRLHAVLIAAWRYCCNSFIFSVSGGSGPGQCLLRLTTCQVLVLIDATAGNDTARDRSGSTSSRTEALLPIGIEGSLVFFAYRLYRLNWLDLIRYT